MSRSIVATASLAPRRETCEKVSLVRTLALTVTPVEDTVKTKNERPTSIARSGRRSIPDAAFLLYQVHLRHHDRDRRGAGRSGCHLPALSTQNPKRGPAWTAGKSPAKKPQPGF